LPLGINIKTCCSHFILDNIRKETIENKSKWKYIINFFFLISKKKNQFYYFYFTILMPGTLIVKPQYARLTHDTETFARMDPYCTVKVGSQSQSTNVCENGGKNPNWGSSSLSFRITSEDIINVEIWDKDLISKNDLIGQGSLSLSTITASGSNSSLNCSLLYKGKSAGEVYMQFEWYSDAGGKAAAGQQGFAMPPLGYPYPPQYPTQGYPQQYPPGYGYQQPAPGYQQPAPGYQQPAPGYQQPTPGYQQSAPGYQQPAPGYQQPAPGYQQPTPGYQQPAPGYQQQQPAPGYQQQQTAPGYQQQPAGGYQQQQPGYQQQQPAPGYQQQQPRPGYQQQPGPGYQQQQPAAPGYQQQPGPGYQKPGYQQPGPGQQGGFGGTGYVAPVYVVQGGGFGGGYGGGGLGGFVGGIIDSLEWSLGSHITKHHLKKHRDQIFYKYDRNRNGYLSHKELYFAVCELFMLMNHPPPPVAYVNELMYEYDSNGDGRMSHKEFKKFTKHLCRFDTKHKRHHHRWG